ncbi:hypothetical protein HYV82_02545 [Candidatus Woesearchaeota archaeon]|nr:hypothetical protein [Candidatus Woesearchaeota archaeon]
MKPRTALLLIAIIAAIASVLFLGGCAQQQSTTDCPKIREESRRNTCFYDKAVNASDGTGLSGCGNITSSSLRDGCMAQVAINIGDAELCLKPQSSKSIGYCYAQISMNKGNMTLCIETPDKFWRHACTKQIAIATSQPQYCRQLAAQSEEDRDECFGLIALKKKDRGLCNEILKYIPRRNCLLYVAIATQNVSMCRETESTAIEGYCYTKIAEQTANQSICSLIPLDAMQADCYKKFGVSIKTNGTVVPLIANESELRGFLANETIMAA